MYCELTLADSRLMLNKQGHGRVCSRLVAGKSSKNPGRYASLYCKGQFGILTGRAFYTCPLNRDDPKKCKFFKWEDELDNATSTTPQKPNPIGAGRTLGQAPQSTRTPMKAAPPPSKNAEPEVDEIDWDKVDTDDLETQAILSTPGSSQRASQQTPKAAPTPAPGSGSFQDRLRAAVDDGVNKRKRDDEEQTPKRARVDADEVSFNQVLSGARAEGQNPFLSTPTTPRSPAHPILSPALASLDQVSEHIQRRERLLRADNHMKQALRNTIASLKDKNEQLELRVKELERQLGGK